MFCLGGNFWNTGGHLAADFIEEFLEIDVCFGCGGDNEIKRRGAGQARLFTHEPIYLGRDRNLGGEWLVGGWGELKEENGFLLIAVADEGRGENFFGKWKLKGASGPAGGEFPGDGGREAGVAGIFPVNMPTWHGAKAKSEGDRLAGLDEGRLGEEVDRYLRGFGDGACEEGGG